MRLVYHLPAVSCSNAVRKTPASSTQLVDHIRSVVYAKSDAETSTKVLSPVPPVAARHNSEKVLDQVPFWNAIDLTRKVEKLRTYYDAHRVHGSLDGAKPSQ